MSIINISKTQSYLEGLKNQVIKQPVVIEKDGKSYSVLISNEEYERFLELEDFYWANKADQASKNDFLSREESEDFLEQVLKN